VEVTTNGAVPVATLDISLGAVTLAVAVIKLPATLPLLSIITVALPIAYPSTELNCLLGINLFPVIYSVKLISIYIESSILLSYYLQE
jgi:hypothetical protein